MDCGRTRLDRHRQVLHAELEMRRGRKPKEAQKAAEVDLAQEIGPAKRTMSFIGARSSLRAAAAARARCCSGRQTTRRFAPVTARLGGHGVRFLPAAPEQQMKLLGARQQTEYVTVRVQQFPDVRGPREPTRLRRLPCNDPGSAPRGRV